MTGDADTPPGAPDHPWRRALRLVAPYRLRMAALLVSSFLTGALEAGMLVLATRTAIAIAEGTSSFPLWGSRSLTIGNALWMIAFILVLRISTAWMTVRTEVGISVLVSNSLRRQLSSAYLDASWAVQHSEPAGRLQQLVTEYSGKGSDAIASLATAISATFTLSALLLVAMFVDPIATVLVIIVLAVLILVLTPIRKRVTGRSRHTRDAGQNFAKSVAELGTLGLEMQAFGVKDQFRSTISDLVGADGRARTSSERLRRMIPHTYVTMAFAALVLGLAIVAQSGTTALGAVMLLMLRSLFYGQQLQTSSAMLLNLAPFLQDIDDTIDRYNQARATSGDRTIDHIGTIAAQGLGFAYRPGQPILDGLDFRIEPGEVVGIIGPSGAGKSTLVQLLLGVRNPTAGTLMVDGVPLAEIDRSSWAPLIGFVAQDALLLTGTVAENIGFFRDEFDLDDFRRAATQANVIADIEALPMGFDTHLGERATELSGGQRQRLSIARALVGQPQFLILDEPTSALDSTSESLIRDTLLALRGKVTVVIIAHRMSTLDICDRIMVIEGGRLLDFDTPTALRANSDFYQQALALSGLT